MVVDGWQKVSHLLLSEKTESVIEIPLVLGAH